MSSPPAPKRQKNDKKEEQPQVDIGSIILPPGILLVGKQNQHNKFFLASTENLFAGFRVSTVMLDSGCNTMLLPLADGELSTVVKTLFPVNDPATHTGFRWAVSKSLGAVHESLVLKITQVDKDIPFNLQLCSDLLKDIYQDAAQPPVLQTEFLSFYLCSDDMTTLQTSLASFLDPKSHDTIEEFLKGGVFLTFRPP